MNSLGAAVRTLDAVRELGVKVSIDDFGSGYSSLAYLRKLPVDTLKVDRAFVQEIAEQANDRAITAAIIAMAHKLGLKVVAEGVERSEEHTSELQSLMRTSYAVFCLQKKQITKTITIIDKHPQTK